MHIVWLKTELLHPVDKGGKIRTYNMLRELAREHRVTYVALDDGSAAPEAAERAAEYCSELVRVPFRTRPKRSAGFYAELGRNLASTLPYAVWKYRSPEMRRRVAALAARPDVDVLVCDFLFPSINVPDDVPCPAVLFQHNVEAMIWRRHYEVAAGPARAYLRSQWRRMEAFERRECRRYDHVVAVSPEDAAVLAAAYGVADVSAVPTGVDTEYFRPSGTAARAAHELVFTGSMDWLPNEDAIVFFAEQVLPRVRTAVPDASLTVVGRNPPPRVLALAERISGLRVTGGVPDVRPYVERAAAFVVPLRIGGGTRLKIFEAMAMETPVISTPVGAEGLPLRDGEHLRLAEGAEAFAAAVVATLAAPNGAAAMARRAAAFVRGEFGWRRVAAEFARTCASAAGSPRAAGGAVRGGAARGAALGSPAST